MRDAHVSGLRSCAAVRRRKTLFVEDLCARTYAPAYVLIILLLDPKVKPLKMPVFSGFRGFFGLERPNLFYVLNGYGGESFLFPDVIL